MTDHEEGEKPDILRGENPPGEWRHRSIGGGSITFCLPIGVGVEDLDPSDEEWVELVMEKLGEYGDSDRDWKVWVIDYNPDEIVMNYSSIGKVIGEGENIDEATEIAVDYMEQNPGKTE